MTPWDSDKSTATDPDNPNADEQLTASEWDQHVADGHWLSDDFTLGTESGDPVIRDPQNSNQVVLRYDRAQGTWVMDALSTEELGNSGSAVSLTDALSRGGMVDSSTQLLAENTYDGTERGQALAAQFTPSVGSSATTIFNAEEANIGTAGSALVLVLGEAGSGTGYFSDIVHMPRDTFPATIDQQDRYSDPTRTYDKPFASDHNLTLSVDQETWDVTASALVVQAVFS